MSRVRAYPSSAHIVEGDVDRAHSMQYGVRRLQSLCLVMELSGHIASQSSNPICPENILLSLISRLRRDVTRYLPLFENSGTFIFQLDNLLETGLNGQYDGQCTCGRCKMA